MQHTFFKYYNTKGPLFIPSKKASILTLVASVIRQLRLAAAAVGDPISYTCC